MKKIFQYLIIIIFTGLLFLPMIGLIGVDFPRFDIKNNGTIIIDNFFDTHLFKQQGVQTYFSHLQLFLGFSPDEDIAILGDNGFLFVSNSNDRELESYRGIREFDNSHYDQAIEKLIGIESYFSNQGIDFLLMIAPDKSTVYSDYMPKRISRTGITPREVFIDKIIALDLHHYVLDLAPNLIQVRTFLEEDLQGHLYYKGDSHWNNYGAFMAFEDYLEFEDLISPEDVAYPKIDSVVVDDFYQVPDMAKLIKAPYFPDYEITITTKPIINPHNEESLSPNSNWRALFLMQNDNAVFDETVFLFRDSFAFAQLDYFSYLFSKVYVVHYQYVLLEETIPELEKMINDYAPDRVILEIVERRVIDRLLLFADLTE